VSVEWKKTTCSYCGLGCGLMVGLDGGKLVDIKGMKGHPVNDGRICILPANYTPVFEAEGRLSDPMIRSDGKLTTVKWNEAINHVAVGLKNIVDKHGPNSIALHMGATCFNEEYYIANKFMKAAIGTNNIECTTRLCMSSSAMGFVSTIGADAPPACYDDVEEADLLFIAGNNMAVSVPAIFARVCAAKKENGTKVIVVDPRRTETAAIADIHLQILPGTDVALNNALAHVLFEEGYVDEEAVGEYASGLSDLKDLLKEYTPLRAFEITGCPEDQIREAARLIGSSKAMLVFWFQGYNHSTQAVFKNNTLHNLWLLTDNFCRPGAGPLSITGESNALGNRWMGGLSHLLPGMRTVVNPQHRQELSDFWKIPLEKIQPAPGRSIIEMIEGLHSGKVRALWVISSNPAASLPNSKWVREGLSKAELIIVQDIFHPTETSMMADVVLAGAHWFEKTGTFISSERRIELVDKIIDSYGNVKPDYDIICRVAQAMGFENEFQYASSEEVFEELKTITKGQICDMNGVTYERLRNGVGPQLPCPDSEHSGTVRLFTDRQFPRPDGRAALLPRKYIPPSESPDEEYPYVLITGKLPWHFNTRTRTGRVSSLESKAPDNFVEINPVNASQLGIVEGEEVEVASRRGAVSGAVRITDSMLPNTIFMPMHFGNALKVGDGRLANLLTNHVCDLHSKQPEYKYSVVKISKIDQT